MTAKNMTIAAFLDSNPDVVAILSRPVNGMGGYQSAMRKLQDAFGIVPRISATTVTPRNPVLPGRAVQVATPQAAPAVGTLDAMIRDLTMAEASKLLAAGDLTGARDVLARLTTGAATASVPRLDESQSTTTDDSQTDDGQPVTRKRRKIRMTAARKERYRLAAIKRAETRKANIAAASRTAGKATRQIKARR